MASQIPYQLTSVYILYYYLFRIMMCLTLTANSYLTRNTEHRARSTKHAARINFNSYFHVQIMRAHDQIQYIVFNGKVEICSTREFSSVLRASVNQTMGIHSFNFSSVLRAACKYELALNLSGFQRLLIRGVNDSYSV